MVLTETARKALDRAFARRAAQINRSHSRRVDQAIKLATKAQNAAGVVPGVVQAHARRMDSLARYRLTVWLDAYRASGIRPSDTELKVLLRDVQDILDSATAAAEDDITRRATAGGLSGVLAPGLAKIRSLRGYILSEISRELEEVGAHPIEPEIQEASTRKFTVTEFRRAILEMLAAAAPGHCHIVNTLGRSNQQGDLERYLKVTFDDDQRQLARRAFQQLAADDRIAPSMTDLVEPMNWYRIRESGHRELAGVAGWQDETSIAPEDADDQTVLYRKGAFERDAGAAIVYAQVSGTPISCLVFDVDDFKRINDTLGHPEGDDVIRMVADCIGSATRGRGRAYHNGGDEFAALLVNTTAADARQIAKGIGESVSRLQAKGGHRVSVSVGLSSTSDVSTSAELIRQADDELLSAKRGRPTGRDAAAVASSLALYEKRHRVYSALMALISAAVAKATITDEELRTFLQETKEAEFLFGEDVREFLRAAYRMAVELHAVSFRLAGNELPVGEKRNEVVKREIQLLDWFTERLTSSIDLFKPYLDLSKKQP